MAAAINGSKNGVFPNYFIVILDNDLVSFLEYTRDGVATMLGTWVEWLAKEFDSLIKDHLNQLPSKCKKANPFLYWVTAPIHSYFLKDTNNLRIKFNLSLESVIRTYPNMRVVKIKEAWNPKDSRLVIHDRLTESGFSSYWNTIDATFKYNVTRREVFLAKSFQNHSKPNKPQVAEISSADTQVSPAHDPVRQFFKNHHDRHSDTTDDHNGSTRYVRYCVPYDEYRMGTCKDCRCDEYVGHRMDV